MTARTPEERFLARIKAIEDTIARPNPLRIPVLDDDPAPEYPGNIWAHSDGRLKVRTPDGTVYEYTGLTSTGSSTAVPNPVIPAQPVTRVGTYYATWSQAYRQSGGYTGGNNNYLYYGDSGQSSYNGKQTSLIGFNYSTIASDLAGASIDKVELYLKNLHTWKSAGGTVYFGSHNNATKPTTLSGIVSNYINNDKVYRTTPGPEVFPGGWHTLSNAFGSALRDGGIRGVVLQAPNNSNSYYGYAAGVTVQAPILKITYTK